MTWIGATVKVNGKRFKTVKRSQLTRPVKLTGLPTGKFVLAITAKTSDRRSATAERSYEPCATKNVKPAAGSYSGDSSPGYALRFYVSAAGTQLQDITIQAVALGCTPGGSYDDQSFSIPAIAIAANGSFTVTTTATGVIHSGPAKLTYTFSGHFNGSNVAGQVRDDITYNNGIAYSCTSNNLSWSATRDTQGSQTASPPPAGSYSGDSSPGYALRFYVSAGGTQLQDITIQAVALGCTPGGSYDDQSFSIPAIAIAANGSFTGTTTSSGVINGAPATITYTFSGHFHGTNSSGVERAAGQVRDDITYNNGTAYSCTSNNLSWSATRDTQGSQTTSPPPAGSYSGDTSPGYALRFYVSAGGTQLQDITIQAVALGCTPGGSYDDQSFSIPAIAIAANGSFTGTTTSSGVINGAPATITYTFSGHFHGTNSSGVERAAGQVRDDITYNNGTAYSCTSNNLSWSAT